ncbi:MAG: polysaccharide deacetylase family protein [Anaerolineales bacterium]|nr:polysaccharide deacetylase family protein [Anaerolineales bacterium]
MEQFWPLTVMYHGIMPEVPGKASHELQVIYQSEFEQHLRILKRRYSILHPDEFAGYILEKKSLPPGCAMVTIDDGLQNAFDYALPVAEALQAPILVFVSSRHLDGGEWLWFSRYRAMLLSLGKNLKISPESLKDIPFDRLDDHLDAIGAPRRSTGTPLQRLLFDGADSAQLAVASQSPYLSIGGHTQGHSQLTRISSQERREEIKINKHLLEEITGKPVRFFAYPGGVFNLEVARDVKQAGYLCAFATEPWFDPLPQSLRYYQIPRFGIYRSSKLRFWLRCSGISFWPKRLKRTLLSVIRLKDVPHGYNS